MPTISHHPVAWPCTDHRNDPDMEHTHHSPRLLKISNERQVVTKACNSTKLGGSPNAAYSQNFGAKRHTDCIFA
ncbi:hypothetical protein OH76DRAFT_1406990 [Lentinus brumalis]|uniref:Uncharacterized protein n=1 Tax=Lentinus brumalis TaxID=2498619 RepID=A0A371D1S0_9APHY|nr:hypothetical protein OH76DRAFT_1406990 [Polyporus brumalis]